MTTQAMERHQPPGCIDAAAHSAPRPRRADAQNDDGGVQVLRHCPLTPPAGHAPFPREAVEGSVVGRFEEQAGRYPAKIALRTPSAEWSYAELNASANRVAHGILSTNGANGTPVAVLMDQEGPAVPVLLGVLKAGRPYVFLDPNDPPARWESILNLTGADILITSGHPPAPMQVRTNPYRVLPYEELDAGGNSGNPDLDVGPDHLAAIFFTSGSTGEPKGVARDHRSVLHSTWFNTNSCFISPDDRHSLLYFPGFGASVFCIYDTLLNGATLCCLNPRRMTPADLATWVRAERITRFSPPIGLLRSFLEAVPHGAPFPELRQVTLTGQSIYGSDIREYQSRIGSGTVLCFMLAMTETGIVTHGYLDHTTDAGDGPVPPGYPVADKDIAILDDDGRPVEPGRTGRIAITSSFISTGYWRDEARSRENYRPDAADPCRRTFLTSDRGRFRPDGCLEYFGREDSVVKLRGYRVDLGAVEAVLNSHPSVHAAAVVAGQWHGHEPAMAAYIVPRTGMSCSQTDLRTFIAGKLPAYMAPRHIQFLETMPLTTTGKINRRALPAPGRFRPELATAFVAPRNETEARIALIWSDLLELGDVGVKDDFFELGGDSLHAMRMAMAVEQELHRPLPADFFHTPTIERLALMMAAEAPDHDAGHDDGRMQPTHRTQPAPLSLRQGAKGILSAGPVWRGHALPYGAGIRLQRAMLAVPAIKRHFSARLPLLREWAGRLGIAAGMEELGTTALLANTWKVWRSQALSCPDAVGRWLHINDPHGYLRGAPGSSAGVVLAVPHTGGLGLCLLKVCQRYGRETASVVNAPWLGEDDGSDDWMQRQTKARSRMIWEAQQVLLRGGVVLIAADGLNGRQAVDVEFWGSRRPFQLGAAELAVTTGAAFVPVYSRLDAEGRVQVEIASELTAEGATPQERIVKLTCRYGEAYASRWPQFFASMIWKHLEYNLRPSPEAAQRL
jgi:amino acid adenylation domain-containing protein